MSEYADEKLIKDNGWKIYKKVGNRRFFEDPVTHKVFAFKHAVIVQQERDNAKAEKLVREQQEKVWEAGEEFQKWMDAGGIHTHDIDEMFPPKKRRRASKA